MAQKNYFIVVNKVTGELLLDGGRLPIFWMRKVAKQVADNFPGYTIKTVDIKELETLIQ